MLVVVQIVIASAGQGYIGLEMKVYEKIREKNYQKQICIHIHTHIFIDNTYISVFWSKKGKPFKISSIVRFGRKLELTC